MEAIHNENLKSLGKYEPSLTSVLHPGVSYEQFHIYHPAFFSHIIIIILIRT